MNFSRLSSPELRTWMRYGTVSGGYAESMALHGATAAYPRRVRRGDAPEQRGTIITIQITYISVGVMRELLSLSVPARSPSGSERTADSRATKHRLHGAAEKFAAHDWMEPLGDADPFSLRDPCIRVEG